MKKKIVFVLCFFMSVSFLMARELENGFVYRLSVNPVKYDISCTDYKWFNGFCFDLNLEVSAPTFLTSFNGGYVYGFSLGMLRTPEKIKNIVKTPFMFDVSFLTLGLAYYTRWLANINLSFGFGLVSGKTWGSWINYSKDENGNQKETVMNSASYIRSKFSLGMDYPLTRYLGILGQINFYFIPDAGNIFDMQIGLMLL